MQGIHVLASLKTCRLLTLTRFAIGPVDDMRRLFRRAWEKVQAGDEPKEWDNGSRESQRLHFGSDQGIFNTIYGEQEFQREVMRRRHISWLDKLKGRSKAQSSRLEGGILIDDILNPGFPHQSIEQKPGKPDEFGIGLDYFSEISQQTINTEGDFHFLDFGKDIHEQLEDNIAPFDCPSRVDGALPHDILSSPQPLADIGLRLPWGRAPLMTNICMNTVPVMIHHNGWKDGRTFLWEKTWMQPHARALLGDVRSKNGDHVRPGVIGAASGDAVLLDGRHLDWNELCTAEDEREIFRD